MPPREVRKIRPSGMVPYRLMWARSSRTSSGGIGMVDHPGPVAGQRDDLGDHGLDLVFRAGGTMPAARAAAVATMLWLSSRPQASCLASSGDWPRSGRREPRTAAFK
jgi:hypothetical protein